MKKILEIFLGLVVIGLVAAFFLYQRIFADNVTKEGELYIYKADTMTELEEKIAPFLQNFNSFTWVAKQKSFTKPKAGRYIIKENYSNNDLVNMLRSGNETPIKLAFNNQDTLEKLASRLAEQLETDSTNLYTAFTNESFLKKNNFTNKNVLQIFIPNTYEVYWTITPENLRDKMLVEYKKFWTSTREQKAAKLGLSKNEVITLASIVQKETAKKEERPIVAGLYLNRLKDGWPLQADPTVIYAIKETKGQDFVVKRVLNVDLEINSPYNTYKNTGLPPSQIAMPDISSIDAVLNAENHNYYYMCVDVDRFGYHKFAKSLAQHNRNAAKYQAWLNKNGINR